MKIILSPDQMREVEQLYFAESRTPSHLLMGRAAAELVQTMDSRGLVRGKRILFACGAGGNGGDGLAAARLCHERGAQCTVLLAMPREKYRGDALHYLAQLPASIPVLEPCAPDAAPEACPAVDALPEPDVWVDALFGIGLNRAPAGVPAACVRRMNRSAAPVVSVDIPSGIDGATGDLPGEAVHAALTVTFQCAKLGHSLRHGPDYTGELVVRSIGLEAFVSRAACLRPGCAAVERMEDSDVVRMLPRRKRFSHKNTYGHLLLIAGSLGMAGAAAIAAKAALRSGAGLVTVACPEALVPLLQLHAPEAMCLPLLQNARGAIDCSAVPIVQQALRGKTAIAIGPGLSRNAAPEIVRAVLTSDLPAVIDADALNLIAADPALKALLNERHLITPHPGEAARLISATGSEIDDALALARLGCSVVYKGAVSLIAQNGSLRLSDTGSACMAKGGSGDMLTGIAGALLAQGLSPFDAAQAASHVHGRAGEAAEQALGMRFPTAMDLIAQLATVWKALEQ